VLAVLCCHRTKKKLPIQKSTHLSSGLAFQKNWREKWLGVEKQNPTLLKKGGVLRQSLKICIPDNEHDQPSFNAIGGRENVGRGAPVATIDHGAIGRCRTSTSSGRRAAVDGREPAATVDHGAVGGPTDIPTGRSASVGERAGTGEITTEKEVAGENNSTWKEPDKYRRCR
jgi:hypothetical protein